MQGAANLATLYTLDLSMLNAFLKGKKRGTGAEGESLSAGFAGAEDTLTATVFERLAYLPDKLICAILFSCEIWTQSMPQPRTIESVTFWPRWPTYAGGGTVEPDCVVECDDRILVIEAKRWDYCEMQNPSQLATEWLSADAYYLGRPVWLLAVGGLKDTREATTRLLSEKISAEISRQTRNSRQTIHFAAVSWIDLYQAFEHQCKLFAHRHAFLARIIDDVRQGMLAHGMNVAPPNGFAS